MAARLRHASPEIATAVSGILRALSIGAPVALVSAPPALAQTVVPATLPADIPAQPVAQALAAFANQTGLQLVYVSGVLPNQRSHGVSAGLGINEALTRLLQGTGLRFEYLTPDTIRILTATAPAQSATRTPAGEEPSEVIITANRREENAQDVPITIQTITGDQLKQLNVTTFNNLLQYTPNVTYSGNGPGTGNIFIRGLGFVGTGNQSQATVAPFPNVALYLDDQAMQFPGRNNDVYLVDLDRVEVLEGPQGTLFGGGAQAGVIHYVTNKPRFDATSGDLSVGFGTTAGGGRDTALYTMLNVPLFADSLAVRAVIFSDRRGGYIDNVPSTIGYPPDSPQVAAGVNPIANNAMLAANSTNPITYQGIRLSALLKLNDSWNVLVQQNYQNMDADGYFYAYPYDSNGTPLQRYEIAAFTPAYTKDRYESTAWTLNGTIHDVSVVYTGSYRKRDIAGQQDYSNYLRGTLGSYYGCIGSNAGYFNAARFPSLAGKPLQCYAPVGYWHDTVGNQHHSEELRVSTSEEHRVRALLGAFWEKFVINDDMNFNYLVIPQCNPANLESALAGGADCLSATGPVPGSKANNPNLRENMNNGFGEDVQRGYKQYAFYVNVDVDLIPRVLTLTGGTRRYHYDEFEHGSEWFTETTAPLLLNHPNGACTAAGACGFPLNLDKSENGYGSRANLTWHITPDMMTYYNFSQGFRPGGFNRTPSFPGQAPNIAGFAPYCGAASTDPRCLPGGSLFGLRTFQYARPVGFDSDTLNSNEIGFRSEFLTHRMLLNASIYRMHWNNVQSQLFDPEHLGNTTFVANGPSYTIKGIELQLVARVIEGLTVQGSSSWNSSNQVSTPCMRSAGVTPATPNNPTPAGECITVVGGLPYTNPWGVSGASPPYSPPLQFSVRARYDWNAGACEPFLMIGASHTASMRNVPENFPDGNEPSQNPPTTTFLKYTIPGYTTYDAALGVTKGSWTAQLQGSNITDAYGPTNISSGPFIKAEIPLRPRVLMALFAYRF
jgi:outer membrane receptor protein involved in Fe transport